MAPERDQLELGFSVDTSFMPTYLDSLRLGGLSRLSPSAFTVLQVIKSLADRTTGLCRASVATICHYAGISRPTVLSAIKALVDGSYVVRAATRGPHGSAAYYVIERFTVRHAQSVAGEIRLLYIPANMKEMLAQLHYVVTEAERDCLKFSAAHRASDFLVGHIAHRLKGRPMVIAVVGAQHAESAAVQKAETFRLERRRVRERFQAELPV
jgi:DNA-binding MarR family transcriptional regulator